jgi:putative FmdB family regulatory protein
MPIYEYRCTDCGHRLEALQRLADAPLKACPACGKESLTKLMSAVGFQLKGSGWYATDFKHSGSKPAEKGAAKPDAANEGSGAAEKGEGAPPAASSGDSKSDSKSDAKTAAKPAGSESTPSSSEAKPSAPATPAKPAATGS